MSNGVEHFEKQEEVSGERPKEPTRFEVVLERVVIVYAADIESASIRAQQVDGVAGRYKVVEVTEVGPSALEERPKLIDEAPSRETQK